MIVTRSAPRRFAVAALGTLVALYLLLFAPATASSNWASPGSLPSKAGHVWSLAVDPGNVSNLIAGTDVGVFRSTDAGATWNATNLSGVRVWAVGFDMRDGHVAYAGTQGQGAYTSSEDATSWQRTALGLSSQNVRSLAFSLAGVAAGTDNGVCLTTDGKTWGPIGLGGVSIDAITVVANSPSLVLIAGTDSGDVSKGSVFISSGKGWARLNTDNGLRTGAFASSLSSGPPTQANSHRTLAVTMSAAGNGSGNSTTYPATFRSLDSGANWEAALGIPELGGVQPIGITTTAFSPLDPSVVYAGADAGGSAGGDLIRSTDGGLNFAPFNAGLPSDSKNVTSIAVAPTTPPTVYAAIDSDKHGPSIYKSSDTQAPPPPSLLAEAPGQPIPSAAVQITALPTSRSSPTPSGTPAPATGVVKVVQSVFSFPVPLVYELIVVIGAAYFYSWWKQRSYIEGPPD